MKSVRVNGIDIAYEMQVDGEPLVLVYGGLLDLSLWSFVAPSRLPDASVETVPGAHAAMLEYPAEYAHAITGFVESMVTQKT